VEAGVTTFWYKYVGLDGRCVGVDKFGTSAPAAVALKALGITVERVVEEAKAMLA